MSPLLNVAPDGPVGKVAIAVLILCALAGSARAQVSDTITCHPQLHKAVAAGNTYLTPNRVAHFNLDSIVIECINGSGAPVSDATIDCGAKFVGKITVEWRRRKITSTCVEEPVVIPDEDNEADEG